MRFVVVVRIEDALRVFGTYSDRDRAEAFADKLNAEIEAREDAEQEAWNNLDSDDKGMAPDFHGRAGVLYVHTPRYREALAFGLTGNPDPSYARKGAI